MPRRISFTEMEGLQPNSDFFGFRILKHTVPEGYTLGWNKTGLNTPRSEWKGFKEVHLGGTDG
jgi:hypothetical protein